MTRVLVGVSNRHPHPIVPVIYQSHRGINLRALDRRDSRVVQIVQRFRCQVAAVEGQR